MLPRFEWTAGTDDDGGAAQLAQALNVPPAMARALLARGLNDAAAAEKFLSPNSNDLSQLLDLPLLAEAVQRLWQAVDGREAIVIFGDYDADGICAAAVLAAALEAFGGNVRVFLPKRLEEGYGLSSAALQRFFREHTAPGLVVTVDCGITAAGGLRALRAAGHDVIITDHHTPDDTLDLSLAGVVLTPHHPETPPPCKTLCGAGVAFALACAMWKTGKEQSRGIEKAWHPRPWFSVVALATVADVAPLTGLNRTLAHMGLKNFETDAPQGLRALLRKAHDRAGPVTSHHLAFLLGPRLNAAGRLGDAQPAYDLLRANDDVRARELVMTLDQCNVQRRQIEENILAEARRQMAAAPPQGAVVVGGAGWHLGALGIVASRLCEQTRLPVAVAEVSPDSGAGRGSLRACHGYDALQALRECAALLDNFGGHRLAAGFAVKPGCFDEFRLIFMKACAAQRPVAAGLPELALTAWLAPAELNLELCRELQRLEPFGEGNPQPCWGMRAVALAERPRLVGSGGQHITLTLQCDGQTMRAVWFRAGPEIWNAIQTHETQRFDVAFECLLNNYRGEEKAEMRIVDMRLSRCN